MTDGYTFNRVKFTKDEETCILALLRNARQSDCSYPGIWHPIIDSIIQKYYDSNIKEAQEFQTL